MYFVQGILGLSRLALSFYFKDDLGVQPAQVAALTSISYFPWCARQMQRPRLARRGKCRSSGRAVRFAEPQRAWRRRARLRLPLPATLHMRPVPRPAAARACVACLRAITHRVIKPLYGFISDSVPLFGYRRRSYLALCGVMGASAPRRASRLAPGRRARELCAAIAGSC